MTLTLDHIVIAVNDLDSAIADYTALGFHVLRGGAHPGRTTHNALVVFGDGSYFELIAWTAPAPHERWWQWLQRHGEGVVDFALLPADTAATVADAARRGLVLEGPLDGGRVRPDGQRLRWQTARPSSTDLPFLCGDISPRALRVPEGDARIHPNGVAGVASLSVVVPDIDASLARYRALLGEAGATAVGPAVTLPDGRARVAAIALGGSTLLLVSPQPHEGDNGDEGDRGDSTDALANRLATHGDGPFSVFLRSASEVGRHGFDSRLTHGTPLRTELAAVVNAPIPARSKEASS
ncbi:VOC family protein [soil metagenome]